jgi:hypothetical protein
MSRRRERRRPERYADEDVLEAEDGQPVAGPSTPRVVTIPQPSPAKPVTNGHQLPDGEGEQEEGQEVDESWDNFTAEYYEGG